MEQQEYLELREWGPLIDLLEKIPVARTISLIPPQKIPINITCIHAVEEFIALGTNVGLIFWYNRAKRVLKEFRCDSASLTCIRIVSTIEYLIAAGDHNGTVFIYQLQKELPDEIVNLGPNLVQKPNEKYFVRGVHKGPIKCLEWSKNGMKLFSGDKLGLIVLTEFDFLKHESRSSEIFNEAYEIVQLRFELKRLLASSILRTVICEPSTIAGQPWKVCQVGKKDRKLLSICGATFFNRDRPPQILCIRPGGRIWIADVKGTVEKTMVFKDIFEARRPDVSLINPSRKLMKISNEFELVHSFMTDYCVTFNKDAVFVLNLRKNRVEATVKYLRAVFDVAVNNQEIFILEGPRTIIRIGPFPDPYADVRSTVFMNRSSATNFQLDLRGLESIYEHSLTEYSAVADITDASECQELPPIEHLDVKTLIQKDFPGHSSDEHSKRLEKFNEISGESFDDNILFKSRRLKVQEALSPSDIRPRGSGIVEIAQLVRADDDKDEESEGEKGCVAMEPLQLDAIVLNEERENSSFQSDSMPSGSKSDRWHVKLPKGTLQKDISPDPDLSLPSPIPATKNDILSQILNYSFTNFDNDHLEELCKRESRDNVKLLPKEIFEAAFLHEVTDIPDTEIDLEGSESSRSTSRQNSGGSILSSDWEIVEHNQ